MTCCYIVGRLSKGCILNLKKIQQANFSVLITPLRCFSRKKSVIQTMSLEQKLKSNFSAVKYDDEVAYDSPPQSAPRPQVANRIASRPSSNIIGVALEPEKPKVALRNFFPENWLFELINVNEETLKRCNL